jgi:hypothetical protein
MVLVAGGCRSELNPAYCAAHPTDTRCTQAATDGGLGGDANGDAPPVCVGVGTYQVCLAAPPTTPQMLNTNINTSSNLCLAQPPSGWISAGQPDSCFVVGTDLTISSTISARGPRPLVLVATGTITLDGELDVAGKRGNGSIPPGFTEAACSPFTVIPMANAGGSGGGAGGTLSTKGGDGGDGDGTSFIGGKALDVGAMPSVLRAGCGGQDGAGGNGTAIGGDGGGAVYLVAGTEIAFGSNAMIDASGAGGMGGTATAGGAGGGTGGMIVLAAPTVTIGTGVQIFANGGGGASGAGNATGGGNGGDATSAAAGGVGGQISNGGGVGGIGASQGVDAVSGTSGTGGVSGGAGGGGLGYIATNASLAGAVTSPAATSL